METAGRQTAPEPPFRSTLAAISGLYALFNAGIGMLAWNAGLYPRFMVGYAALLALAGLLLLRSRPFATAATLLAAAAAIAFAAVDLRRGNPQAAALDGSYAVVAAALLWMSRARS